MDGFIDIHCHCLPGVDDGAADIEESLRMIVSAYEDGIREIICTPHFHYRRGHVCKEELEKVFRELCERVWQECPGIQMHLGNELYYDNDLCERLAKKEVCTLAGTDYVLVEFSPQTGHEVIYHAMRELIQEGYNPVLAHVERYDCYVKKPVLAKELAEMGVYLQVNAGAVLGDAGRKTAGFIKKLFRAGLVHFVATDAHDTETRMPQLARCAAYVNKKYGRETAVRCFSENQQAVISGKIV